MENYKLVTRDNRVYNIPVTPNLIWAVNKFGTKAVTVQSGLCAATVSHIIDPDGKTHLEV